MQKKINKYEREHLRRVLMYQRQIDEIYQSLIDEGARIAAGVNSFKLNKPFVFKDYPATKARIEKLINQYRKQIGICVVNGINSEWELANDKNNSLVKSVFGASGSNIPQDKLSRFLSNNETAREAFLRRKDNGMNLSDKVWRYSDEFKSEIEMGLDIGLRERKNAQEIARDLKQYLRHPDKLFRRVRDEHGILHLSKNARNFHPGQGVYRSSYMNARRLAATETNMAYRSADYERLQQMDFVVGVEIHLSNNHTCKGSDGIARPFTDICDDLQGKYPKDFKFTGWHPHCRCFATSILKTDAEIDADTQKILNDKPLEGYSLNRVEKVPGGFQKWLNQNSTKISRAKQLPYFLRDNGVMNEGKYILKNFGCTIMGNQKHLDVRIRTREEILQAAKKRHAARTKEEIRRIQDLADEHTYGKEYVENVHKLENSLGIQRGKRMNHKEANTGRVNPGFGKRGFNINCSTCSGTYILRRMGFNVSAKPNIVSNPKVVELSKGSMAWRKWNDGLAKYNSTRSWMEFKGYNRMTKKRYQEFLEEKTKTPGIYEFNIGYKGGGGHSTLLVRGKDNILSRIEQQIVREGLTLDNLLNYLTTTPSFVRGVMRVDNAMFNPEYASIVNVVLK